MTPQFPFGYGLSYTRFTLSHPEADTEHHTLVVHLRVANDGHRAGTAVVQAYVRYPPVAGEPPDQLRAFDAVSLGPSQARAVRLTLPVSAFEAYIDGALRTVAGTYSVDIGQSSGNLPIHLRAGAP